MHSHDRSVSEIVGTLLVFAIVISLFSSFEMWYVPNTQSSYESQFQANSMNSLSSLISQLDNPSLVKGQIITQNFPLGIQGSMLTPATQTSLSFDTGGFNSSMNYTVGVNYKLLENTVPTAVTNKVIGTTPAINGKVPTSVVYVPLTNDLYVTDYGSSSISVINASSHEIVGEYYAGMHPFGIAYNGHGSLYITNDYSFYSSFTGNYSTVSVFNVSTDKIVKVINDQGTIPDLLYPSGISYVRPPGQSYGYMYVYGLNNTGTVKSPEYMPQVTIINTTNYQVTGNISYNSYGIGTNLASSYVSEGSIINFKNTSSTPECSYIWWTDYYQNSVTEVNISGTSVGAFAHPVGSAKITSNHVYISSPYGLAYNNGDI